MLCEKAFTVNAAQARKLVQTAKERKLFLMEAVWTRFFPLSIQIREMIQDGELGDVYRVIADLSFGQDVENTWGADGAKHRMVNPDLAGGALLDRMSHSFNHSFILPFHSSSPTFCCKIPSRSASPPFFE